MLHNNCLMFIKMHSPKLKEIPLLLTIYILSSLQNNYQLGFFHYSFGFLYQQVIIIDKQNKMTNIVSWKDNIIYTILQTVLNNLHVFEFIKFLLSPLYYTPPPLLSTEIFSDDNSAAIANLEFATAPLLSALIN